MVRVRPKVGAASGAVGALRSYQRLLADPCNAAIVASPYGDEAGAQVARGHQVFNNTLDAELVFWHPVLGGFKTNAAAGTSGSLVPTTSISQASFGGSMRAVAGCFEVMYTGAETSRAGTVCCAVVPGAIVWNYLAITQGGAGGVLDTANVSSYFSTVTRTPVDKCSATWFPGDGDENWIPPITLNAAQTGAVEKIFASTHFTAIFVAGAGANAFRYSATGVVETQSLSAAATTSGFAPPWGVAIKSGPPVNWREAVKDLGRKDPAWFLDTFRKVASFGLGLANSTLAGGLPGALGYLTKAATNVAFGGKGMQFLRGR